MEAMKVVRKITLREMLEKEFEVNVWVILNGRRIENLDTEINPNDEVLVIPEVEIGC
jgi:molybdopterin converting factor small subunit